MDTVERPSTLIALDPALFWPLTYVFLFVFAVLVVISIMPHPENPPPKAMPYWLKKSGIPLWLAIAFAAIFGPLFLLALGASTVSLWNIAFGTSAAPQAGSAATLGTSALIAALLGAPFVVWRSIVAQRTLAVAEEGHITDQINKAVEGLGAEKTVKRIVDGTSEEETRPNLEVRIGSIYALERLAQGNNDVHLQILETLTAYVRGNAPLIDLIPREPPFSKGAIRSDIQVALTVIGRRSEDGKKIERQNKFRLDLSASDLSFADLTGADLFAANLIRTRLEATTLREADLSGAWLHGSLLNFADLFKAKLRGTRLDQAIINRPEPIPGGWGGSTLQMSDFDGLSLVATDLSSVQYLGEASDIRKTFGTKDTVLSADLEQLRPPPEVMQVASFRHLNSPKSERSQGLIEKLEASGFENWCAYDSRDLAVEHHRGLFLKERGIVGWPYDS